MAAIQFPCLDIELSHWSSPAGQQPMGSPDSIVMNTALDNFFQGPKMENNPSSVVPFPPGSQSNGDDNQVTKQIIHFPALEQPKSAWIIDQDITETDNVWIAATSAGKGGVNLMEPVLKETPKSHWLSEEVEDEPAQERAASLVTSLWLASSARCASSLTCQNADTAKAAAIEWPSILFRQSNDVWLQREEDHEEQHQDDEVLDETVDRLLKMYLKSDKEAISMTNSSVSSGIWSGRDSPNNNMWLKEEQEEKMEVEDDHNSWLLIADGKESDGDDKILEDKVGDWLRKSTEDLTAALLEEALEDSFDDGEESSIAVLETFDDDFEAVEEPSEAGFWLL